MRALRSTSPFIVLLLVTSLISGVGGIGVAASAVPTLQEIDIVASAIDVSAAAGLIVPASTAKSFKAKLVEMRKAIAAGDGARASRLTDAFLKELDARRGRGLAAAAAGEITLTVTGELYRCSVVGPK